MKLKYPRYKEAIILWSLGTRKAKTMAMILCLCDGKIRSGLVIANRTGIPIQGVRAAMGKAKRGKIPLVKKITPGNGYQSTHSGLYDARNYIEQLKQLEDAQKEEGN